MNSPYRELAQRVRDEVPDLERVIQRVLRAWELCQCSPGQQDVYLDSVALNLHGFYSGIERLFELIARHVDRDPPAGETWHYTLLQQMTRDEPDLRPAVISVKTALTLDRLRRFRHLVRNVYTLNLVPEKIEPLVSALPGLWPQLKAELLAFADFLETLAQAVEI